MTGLRVILEGDGSMPELAEKMKQGLVLDTQIDAITALPRGMVSGKTSVAVIVNLPDGRVVFAQTTLALLQAATRAFTARYGEHGGGA